MKLDAEKKEPHPLKPKVLLWADISYNDMEEMDNMKSIPELERTLCRVLRIDAPEPGRGVLLELYVHTVLFCRESSFNKKQTSALLSIVKSMHQANTEPPVNNMDHCFAYCCELLLCHSVRRPPFSINLFSSEEVIQILKYLLNSYIRHYNLYKYIFTPQVRLDLSLSYSGMPDIEEAQTEDSALTVLSDGEKVTEKEPETEQEQPTESQELSSTVTAAACRSPKAELRTRIQQEVRKEMLRMSGQLEGQLKKSADQLNRALASLESNLQGKK